MYFVAWKECVSHQLLSRFSISCTVARCRSNRGKKKKNILSVGLWIAFCVRHTKPSNTSSSTVGTLCSFWNILQRTVKEDLLLTQHPIRYLPVEKSEMSRIMFSLSLDCSVFGKRGLDFGMPTPRLSLCIALPRCCRRGSVSILPKCRNCTRLGALVWRN